MRQLLVAMMRGFVGRCPLCGKGPLFASFYRVHERCSACGVRYEPTSGQNTGAMAINLVMTIVLGFIGGILLVLYMPEQLFVGMAAMIAILALFHIVFYRFARGLWLGMLVATGDLAHDRDELG